MKRKIIMIIFVILMIPIVLTKIFDEKFLSFWGGYIGAVATLAVVYISKYYEEKDKIEREVKIIQLILQNIYLEYEEILEKYNILLMKSKINIDFPIVERKIELSYIRSLLIEVNDNFASIANIYLLCIEKELCNIEILRKGLKEQRIIFQTIDVEKRLIPVKNLVDKMLAFGEDNKSIKEYSRYYKKILDEYRDNVEKLENIKE